METLDTVNLDNAQNLVLEYEETLNSGYFDFRFTFSDQDKDLKCLEDKQFIGRSKSIYKALISHLEGLQYFTENIYTSGFEIMNRKGENCRAHIHLRFKSKLIKNSMHRTIKRFLETYEQETTGNKAMMFKTMIVPRNEEEFWRYPLKQNLSKLQRGFTPTQLTNMHEIAKASYEKTIQVSQSKLDRQDTSDTLFDRVMSKLNKDISPNTTRKVATAFLALYVEENRPINKTTIDGYILNAQIKLGILTQDALLEKWGY